MSKDIKIVKVCCLCGCRYLIEVYSKDYSDWQNGVNIQIAFPYLNIDDRELLISGVCGSCFDENFGDASE